MDRQVDILSLIILSLTLSYQIVLMFLKTRKNFNLATALVVLNYALITSLVICEFLCLSELLSGELFTKISSITLVGIHGLFLCGFILLSVKELSSKKIKTLWRIPIISLLVGALGVDYQLFIHFGIWVLLFIIYLVNRDGLRNLALQVIFMFIWVFIFGVNLGNSFWGLNISLVCFIMLSYNLWNMVFVKMLLKEKHE